MPANFQLTVDFTNMYGMTPAHVLLAQKAQLVAAGLPVATVDAMSDAQVRAAILASLNALPTASGTDITAVKMDYLDGATNYKVEFLSALSTQVYFKGALVTVPESHTWRLNYHESGDPAPYSTILYGTLCSGNLKLSTPHEFPVNGTATNTRIGLAMAADTACGQSTACPAAKSLYKDKLNCCETCS
jgi:hypothetical protein